MAQGLIDARGGVNRLDYDPGNRLISTTDAEGRVITYTYDARGNVVVQTTGTGTSGAGSLGEEVTRFEYDAKDNLLRVTDAEGGVRENVYDRTR